MFFHFIKKGDSLYQIAKEYNVDLNKIIQDNSIIDPENLVINQCLLIDDNILPNKKTSKVINAYCYDTSNIDTVKKSIYALTFLSIFGYKVDENGNLNSINDEPYIRLARENNVKPIMVITNSKEKGGFSPSLANAIISNKNTTQNLFNKIENHLKNKNYYGLNIDFEYVSEDDKNLFIDFVKSANDYFKSRNYYLSISLAPKYSDQQKGTLYTAHDYEELGKYVDHVIIMAYEWGYTYGPAMAVSPYYEVKKVLEYAKEKIPSNKILMGLPNYGYDFIIPYKKNQKAKSIKNAQAIPLAYNNHVQVQYNKTSITPFFRYLKDDIQHEVHFDDPYSIASKLSLLDDLNIGGVSIWTISTYCGYIPLLIDNYFNIIKL